MRYLTDGPLYIDRGEAYIQTPELHDMSGEEIAFDWVKKVLALPVEALDTNPLIISPEGKQLVSEIITRHNEKYVYGHPYDDGGEAGQEHEHSRRQQELHEAIKAVTDVDPGVAAKNRFLAFLADQFDGKINPRPIVDRLVDVALQEGDVLTDGDKDELTETVGSLPTQQSRNMINLIVSLRRYAEADGDSTSQRSRSIYTHQFLGLWTIYQAGQQAVRTTIPIQD